MLAVIGHRLGSAHDVGGGDVHRPNRIGSQDNEVVRACRPYRGQRNRLIEGDEAPAVVRRQAEQVDVAELSRSVNAGVIEDSLVENRDLAVPVLVVRG